MPKLILGSVASVCQAAAHARLWLGDPRRPKTELAQSKHNQHDREDDDQHSSDRINVRPEPTLFFPIFELRKECRWLAAAQRRRAVARESGGLAVQAESPTF
jgi:hypothetical protein